MRITIKNDGKGKPQSWEAVFNAGGTGWCVSAWAYGANEQEAREDLANRLLKAEFACQEDVKTPKPP